MQEDDAFTLDYGGSSTFFSGLEGLIGSPQPNLNASMAEEHQGRADSHREYTTPNYSITTTPSIEWWFVVEAGEGLNRLKMMHYPREEKTEGHMRAPAPLSAFEAERAARNARLAEIACPPILPEEVIGVRLYTGPQYVRYNGVLRGLGRLQGEAATRGAQWHAEQVQRLFEGNLYTTTLHVINSAIVKLGKLTVAGKVYRGIAGGVLPENFWRRDPYNLRGGCEYAFMSTTTDGDVAMSYASSRGKAGSLFVMQMGMVDRGADIGWLSQYPGEQEAAHPSRLCLDVAQ